MLHCQFSFLAYILFHHSWNRTLVFLCADAEAKLFGNAIETVSNMLKILLAGIPQSQSRHGGLVYVCVCQQFILPEPLTLFYLCLVCTLSIYRELCRYMCRYLRFSSPCGPRTKTGIQATKQQIRQQMYYLPFSRCPSSISTACIVFFLVSRTCESSQTPGKLVIWGSSGVRK